MRHANSSVPAHQKSEIKFSRCIVFRRAPAQSNGENTTMKFTGFVSTTALLVIFGMATPANGRQDHPAQQEDKAKPQDQGKPQEHQQTKPQEKQQPEQQQKQQQQAKGQQEQQQKQQQQHEQQQAKGQQEQQQKQQQQHAQQAQSDKQQQQHEQQQVRSQQSQQHGDQQSNAQPQRSDQHYVPAKMQSQQEQHRQEGAQQSAWQEHRAHNWQSEHRDWQQRGGYNGYRIPEDRYNGYFGSGHSFRIYSYPVMMVGGYPRFQYGGFWFSLVDPWPEYWSNNWYDNDDVYIIYADDGYYLYNRRYPRDRIAVSVYAD